MRILVTGANGQVGWELQRTLQTLGEVAACDRGALDLANPDAIRGKVREMRPDVIVNAGAYTAVDKAESEPELAMAVNGVAPGVLAEEAKRIGALLVHYSTDYVFDGTKAEAYLESDAPNPASVYGSSKLAGERAVEAAGGACLIFRTSWVYAARGKNFLLTILRLAAEREELRVVDDQVGTPTWCRTIAEATAQVVVKLSVGDRIDADRALALRGVYNLTAAGRVSWCGFARAIVEATRSRRGGAGPKVTPITTAEYPLPARRPANSVLANQKLQRAFGLACPAWDHALELCLTDLGT
ncbi:MAG: dTDP-4-dehydrorhamnose reductase [Burkholderiales bacterium]|nr:dTDP-4-dehydrorhamnose reductase [Burkholderiales bacterium]